MAPSSLITRSQSLRRSQALCVACRMGGAGAAAGRCPVSGTSRQADFDSQSQGAVVGKGRGLALLGQRMPQALVIEFIGRRPWLFEMCKLWHLASHSVSLTSDSSPASGCLARTPFEPHASYGRLGSGEKPLNSRPAPTRRAERSNSVLDSAVLATSELKESPGLPPREPRSSSSASRGAPPGAAPRASL